MESRAKLFGHAIHPILIVFPLGLLATAVVFDVVHLIFREPVAEAPSATTATTATNMALVSFWMIAAGIAGGLLAALFGLIDYLAIPRGTRARSVGLWHGLGNLVVLLLFATSWLLRYNSPAIELTYRPTTLALALSFAGFLVAGVSGWLGGELVERLGVGVDDGAHLDAPSSLSGRPARERAGD